MGISQAGDDAESLSYRLSSLERNNRQGRNNQLMPNPKGRILFPDPAALFSCRSLKMSAPNECSPADH